jgi:hypothetical protein
MTKNLAVRHATLAGAATALLAGMVLSLGSTGAARVSSNIESAWSGPAAAIEKSFSAGIAFAEESTGTGSSDTAQATESTSETTSTSITQVGIAGTYDTAIAEGLLDRVNEIRAEAHDEGITVDGQVVSGEPLTWSQALEYMAQVRAAEVSFDFSHARPSTGENILGENSDLLDGDGVSGSKIVSYAEDIAQQSAGQDPASTLELWYAEKGSATAFSSDDSSTGHYVSLISDNYTTIGLGMIETSGGIYLVAELGTDAPASSSNIQDGQVVEMIDVAASDNDYVSASVSSQAAGEIPNGGALNVAAGQTDTLSATVSRTTRDGSGAESTADVTGRIDLSWTSSDDSVATVDQNGVVTGVAPGSATITLSSGTQTLATVSVTVSDSSTTSAEGSQEETQGVTQTETPSEGVSEPSSTESQPASDEPAVTAVSASAEIETDSGVEPAWPDTVDVTMSDGTTQTASVVWDTASLDESAWTNTDGSNPEFTVNGTATLSDGTTIDATLTVTVNQALPAPVSASVEDASTDEGVAPVLPETATVQMSDGSTVDGVAVTWDAVDEADYAEAGTFTATGTVTLDGTTLPVTCQVTVIAAPASNTAASDEETQSADGNESGASSSGQMRVARNIPNILGASKASDSALSSATSKTADDTSSNKADGNNSSDSANSEDGEAASSNSDLVSSSNSDSSAKDENTSSSADDSSESGTDAGSSTSDDSGADSAGSSNDNSASSSSSADDDAASSSSENDASASSSADSSSDSAGSSQNDSGASSTSNQEDSASSEADSSSSSANSSQNDSGSSSASQSTASENATIVSIVQPADVTTASGKAPTLPSNMTANMSDGSTRAVTVTWNDIDPASYSSREGGTFTVHGTIEGYAAGVDINVIVTPATMVSATTNEVTTTAGTAPTLPSVVEVTWSNGDKTNESVTWDAIDASQYASAGSFSVTGTIHAGSQTGTVTCNVTVLPSQAASSTDQSASAASNQVVQTGDTTQVVPMALAFAAGIAVVAAAIGMVVRKRLASRKD